jgi:hypothetical protein
MVGVGRLLASMDGIAARATLPGHKLQPYFDQNQAAPNHNSEHFRCSTKQHDGLYPHIRTHTRLADIFKCKPSPTTPTQLRSEAPIPCTPVMTPAASPDTVAGKGAPCQGWCLLLLALLAAAQKMVSLHSCPEPPLASPEATHHNTCAASAAPAAHPHTHGGGCSTSPELCCQHPHTCVLHLVVSTCTQPQVCFHMDVQRSSM